MPLAKEILIKGKINSVRHEALLGVVRTAGFIDKRGQKFFTQFGITQAQYNVLIILKLEGSLTQIEIGRRLVISRAGITSIIDKLEKKRLVKRSAVKSDRRVFNIELTAEGRKILDAVEPCYLREVEKVMRCLSKTQCRQLNKMLETLRKSLREEE